MDHLKAQTIRSAARAAAGRLEVASVARFSPLTDELFFHWQPAGFATSGTLRKLEHIARDAGFAPGALWRSVDEATTRYLMQQQRG